MTKTIPVKDIPKEIAARSGKEPSGDSVKRWIRDGYRGVKLQISGPLHFRFTRTGWLEEFLDSCGKAGKADHEFAETAEKRTTIKEKAYEILALEFGIGKGKSNTTTSKVPNKRVKKK